MEVYLWWVWHHRIHRFQSPWYQFCQLCEIWHGSLCCIFSPQLCVGAQPPVPDLFSHRCRQLPRLIRKARRLGENCQKCVHLQLRDITVCCRFHPSRDEPVHVNFLWELADCYRTEPGTQCSASSVCPLSFWWSFDTGEEICSSVGFQARLDLERGLFSSSQRHSKSPSTANDFLQRW